MQAMGSCLRVIMINRLIVMMRTMFMGGDGSWACRRTSAHDGRNACNARGDWRHSVLESSLTGPWSVGVRAMRSAASSHSAVRSGERTDAAGTSQQTYTPSQRSLRLAMPRAESTLASPRVVPPWAYPRGMVTVRAQDHRIDIKGFRSCVDVSLDICRIGDGASQYVHRGSLLGMREQAQSRNGDFHWVGQAHAYIAINAQLSPLYSHCHITANEAARMHRPTGRSDSACATRGTYVRTNAVQRPVF